MDKLSHFEMLIIELHERSLFVHPVFLCECHINSHRILIDLLSTFVGVA
jgi:hypothetical protein